MSDTKSGAFAISHGRDIYSPLYYSSHGEFKGEKDVVSYSELASARIFFSKKSAEDFIANELPEWARESHTAIEVSRYDLLIYCPDVYVKLTAKECNL